MTTHHPRGRSRGRHSRKSRIRVPGILAAALGLLAVAFFAARHLMPDDYPEDSPPSASATTTPDQDPVADEFEAAIEEPVGKDTGDDEDADDGSDDGEGDGSGRDEESGLPESGPGTFQTAPGGLDPVGGDEVWRYQLQIEDGLGLDLAETAAEVHAILGHERGWTADGSTGFRLVGPDEPADFMVRIATPGTVDDICGQYGLDTGGEVNCRVGESVMVNLKRWMTGSPEFSGPVEEYRALIINHEVGHFLGHGHEGCPGPGAPAPAMMQQIKGLDGCVANAWPYDENGEYLSGPAVP